MKKIILILILICPFIVIAQNSASITFMKNEDDFFRDTILLKILDSANIDLSGYKFTSMQKILDTTPYIKQKKINFTIVRKVIFYTDDKFLYNNVFVKQYVYGKKKTLDKKFITAYRTLEKVNGLYHIELYSIE